MEAPGVSSKLLFLNESTIQYSKFCHTCLFGKVRNLKQDKLC